METNAITFPTGVYATVSNSANWLPFLAWTCEFWCSLTGNGGAVVDALPWFSIFFDPNNSNKLTVQIQAGTLQNFNTGYAPALNVWHHYAVTRDSSGNVSLYVDGVLTAGPSGTSAPTGTAPANLLMGSNGTVIGGLQLGDVRIWNYARIAADINSMKGNWLDGDDSGLMADWQFLEADDIVTTIGDQAWWTTSPPKTTLHNATITGSGYAFTNNCPVSIANKLDPETPPVTARLDYGFQAAPYHLPMILNNTEELFGLNADVFDESVFDNDYASIYPEYQISQVPIKSVKIFMSQPFGGILTSDYISITQNITKEFKIVSDGELKEQQVLRVWLPDQKTVHLRVVSCLALHPLSALQFVYETVYV